MPTHTPHHRQTNQGCPRSRAFSLLELVVATVILLLIVTFLSSALGRAVRSTRKTASQRSVEAIAAAVEQFRIEFGFLPPLVHDGKIISGDGYYPWDPIGNTISSDDGPLKDGVVNVSYAYKTLVIWSEGYDFDFFRRRAGDASDEVELTTGGVWDMDSAWDDRRYSRYALAYYLTGALPRSVDGVAGLGMARPLADGSFQGVGYPVGGTRDRFQPTVDTDRSGIKLQTGYARSVEAREHGANIDTIQEVYDFYPAEDRDRIVALVDNFGTAYRYYRWEHGRYDNRRRIVIDNSLDMNIPPVLLDPIALVELENDDTATDIPDLTDGDLKLRQARFAIVGAGADRLFGTEPIDFIAAELHKAEPTDDAAIARLRKLAMDDNVVAYGK